MTREELIKLLETASTDLNSTAVYLGRKADLALLQKSFAGNLIDALDAVECIKGAVAHMEDELTDPSNLSCDALGSLRRISAQVAEDARSLALTFERLSSVTNNVRNATNSTENPFVALQSAYGQKGEAK